MTDMMNEATEEITAEEVTETEEVETDTTIEDETTEVEETTEAPDTEEPSLQEQFLQEFKIKYNGEEIGYDSIDDLVTDAQKGRNYQKMVEKYEALRNDPLYNLMQDRMKRDGYNDALQYAKDIRAAEKAQELISQGVPKAQANKLAKELVEKDTFTSPKDREIGEFIEWHTEKLNKGIFKEKLDPASIPSEVMQAYENGQSLKEAYQDYMLTIKAQEVEKVKMQTEQDTLNKIKSNKEKSAGKVPTGKETTHDMTKAQVNEKLSNMSSKQQSEWANANWSMLERIKYFD